ncbi:MAG: RnfABCDGE type electron transport complex subunit C [Candidatus Izemoplasmatales bacterium]|nr:RnfABCDGE type electron transport complex subunit C [Candidatus Izemoplasmatales bacterium]
MIFQKVKGIFIDGKKDMCKKNPLKEYLSPKYVYIPLLQRTTNLEALVKVGDEVKIGQLVATNEQRFNVRAHASVSGKVTSIKKVWHSCGRMVDAIEVENDFKNQLHDSIKEEKNVDGLTREELINKMELAGLTGLGGAGFSTHVKYKTKAKINSVIINAAECEPYVTSDFHFIVNYPEKLLKGSTYLMRAAGAEAVYIAYKAYNKEIREALEAHISKYPNVKLFELKNVYPAGWEKYIVEQITGMTYTGLPADAGVIVNNSGTAIIYSDIVEKNIPLIARPITITGEGITSPCTYYVPIGTKVSDLVEQSGGYIKGLDPLKYNYIAGGPMTGRAIFIDDLIVNDTLGAVIVKPVVEGIYLECLGCGRCADVCPAFLTPTEIKKAFDRKDVKLLGDLNANKCIECGLCSYVCPSHIEITEAVGKGKALLMKGGK